MRILFATPELAPWVKTGGLGDVAGALPAALHARGLDVRILLPNYPALKAAFADAPIVASWPARAGHAHGAALREAATATGLPLYLLECDAYFDRPGNPYLGPEGHDWLDNGLRFGLLSAVAAELAGSHTPLAWRPQVLHCNDWQTGLAPAMMHYSAQPALPSVMTVHNLAFQGLFGREMLEWFDLPESAWRFDGVEYHGYLSFLKAGLQHAEAITTVSPNYAMEIQTEAGGMGMQDLLRHRAERLRGIVNGIDTAVWNPAADPLIAKPYDERHLAAKAENTRRLREEMGLAADPQSALIGIVSRITHQKGLDLLPALADRLGALPVQFAVLGSGERALEVAYRQLAERLPGRFAVRLGFDEGLAHRIEAGADLFLMPSRFEPCGLNQMYSMRYGTPPIVRATGGLADTVVDAADPARGTGFVFQEATPEALFAAITRALGAWQDRAAFAKLRKRGMRRDFSWAAPAAAYEHLYQSLIAQ